MKTSGIVANTPNRRVRGKYESKNKWSRIFRTRRINWYWDLRFWLLPIVVLLAVALNHKDTTDIAYVELPPAVTESVTEATMPETTQPIDHEEETIVALARFADSVGAGRSDDVKRAIVWVAINRSEDRSHGYGLPLLEELSRPKQWQQYNPDGNYMESTYILVKEVYDTWQSGGARMFQDDMLWFKLNADGSVTVRNKFNETKGRAEINIL